VRRPSEQGRGDDVVGYRREEWAHQRKVPKPVISQGEDDAPMRSSQPIVLAMIYQGMTGTPVGINRGSREDATKTTPRPRKAGTWRGCSDQVSEQHRERRRRSRRTRRRTSRKARRSGKKSTGSCRASDDDAAAATALDSLLSLRERSPACRRRAGNHTMPPRKRKRSRRRSVRGAKRRAAATAVNRASAKIFGAAAAGSCHQDGRTDDGLSRGIARSRRDPRKAVW